MSNRDGKAAEETGSRLFVTLAVAQVFSQVRRKCLVNKHLGAECDQKAKIKNAATAALSFPFLSEWGRRAVSEDITFSCLLVLHPVTRCIFLPGSPLFSCASVGCFSQSYLVEPRLMEKGEDICMHTRTVSINKPC